ncbi:hypothetical protein ACODM8_04575 [Vibrio ostreicida]|uniref:hypothetical protein n=1 Tax=Vibrio ostreicida TaxID=526588 RepID=UPI003B59FB8B
MPESNLTDLLSKWMGTLASGVAILGVVFTAGIAYHKFQSLSQQVSVLTKQSLKYEKVLNQHLGPNWANHIEDIAATTELQTRLEGKAHALIATVDQHSSHLSNNQLWIESIRTWAEQQDSLVRQEILAMFRATAVYSSSSSLDKLSVKINRQHEKGRYYKIGDSVLIENPVPPGESVRVSVVGFTNDTKNPDVLVQINASLLEVLGLSKLDGRYELFITNDPQVLRWQSLGHIHQRSKWQNNVDILSHQ